MLNYFYKNIVFKYPLYVLSAIFLSLIFLSFWASKLEIDASAETLLLQNDKDLKFTRIMNKRYQSDDFLFLTYKPKKDLLSNESISNLELLIKDLKKLKEVKSITSILNVPLLFSPTIKIKELVDKIKTLKSPDIDVSLAKKEFLSSPLYKNILVSEDFKTTAILINLKRDHKYFTLLQNRNQLINKENKLSKKEHIRLKNIEIEFKLHRDKTRLTQHELIKEIRSIISKNQKDASLFLGGANMISDDIVTFIKNDLLVYGSCLLLILIIVLYLIFRNIKWVIISIFICILSVIATAGALSFFSWEITVISSNFIALQLIITISIILHLIVRYREVEKKYKNSSVSKIVLNTMLSKSKPSFFAIITTIAGFASLVISDILPIIDLGLMMSLGIFLSLIISFIVFPAILIKLKRIQTKKSKKSKFSLMQICSNFVINDSYKIYIISVMLVILSLIGISKLIVENSFISYFKKDTQIYKGMEIIDKELGGTTPLDIIITFKNEEIIEDEESVSFDEEDSFDEEFEIEENDEKYWFTDDKMQKILKVHNYLSSLEQIGAVQSFATMLIVAKKLNENIELDSFKLALLYNKIPSEYKKLILSPYLSIEHNQVRFATRVIDSNKDLRRNDLINKIYKDLERILPDDKIQLSNLMILYNNMLQSLFDSQIKTMFFVLVILLLMFLILFKSIKIAIISIVSNIIPIGIIFAFMGFGNIPLDIMTITIAAISIGIGVDDTIHYIHRFKKEFKIDKSYVESMKRAHHSIGYAMTYTSLSIILGFSILLLSNLIPTIYFGLLTIIVMFTILASALILLPKLLITFRAFD